MSSSTAQAIQLGPTYGAELLATFVSVALWGTTCMQTVVYFIQYPKDRFPLKALVVWLWKVIPMIALPSHNIWHRLADTVHEVLIVKGVYDSQIVGFCDFSRIESVVPEYLWQVLLTSLVAIPSQAFFTYRIWRFSGKQWFYWAILAPVCLFELAGGLAFIAFGTITPTAAELVSAAPANIFTATQAVAAFVDLTIAAGLMVLLIQSRERALKGSRSILQKLLVLTINTGIWTALFAVFTFIAIIAFKNTLIYAALYFPLCPLYCNTVLANLNARDFLKARSAVTEGGTIDTAYNLAPVFAGPRSTVRTQSTNPTLSTVLVEVNKSVSHIDDEPALRARGSKLELERQ